MTKPTIKHYDGFSARDIDITLHNDGTLIIMPGDTYLAYKDPVIALAVVREWITILMYIERQVELKIRARKKSKKKRR